MADTDLYTALAAKATAMCNRIENQEFEGYDIFGYVAANKSAITTLTTATAATPGSGDGLKYTNLKTQILLLVSTLLESDNSPKLAIGTPHDPQVSTIVDAMQVIMA